jgi:hypothetical protein
MQTNTTRRDLLKAGGLAVLSGVVGGCATATGIKPTPATAVAQDNNQTAASAPGTKPADAPAAKVVQDSSQTAGTPASAGATLSKDTDPKDKPTYVPEAEDPVAYSLADNLFWNDIMMEHAIFFQQLMPGPQLDGPRRQAAEYERLFAQLLEQSRGINASNYTQFNERSIDLAARFSVYKKTMREHQANGKMRSLVWPLFFQHTAREADRFAARLALYNRRQIDLNLAEVIDFWSKTMGEHSGFIAHLLDPDERRLIGQARKLQDGLRRVRGDQVMKVATDVLEFNTLIETGIYAGKIKSIISPRLAYHIRREAVRFVDELKRTQDV